MKETAISVNIAVDDDEGITSVFFGFEDFRYITCCISDEDCDENVYIEKDDQVNSTRAHKSGFSIALKRNGMLLKVNESISSKIKSERSINIEFDIDDLEYQNLKNALELIFDTNF